MSGLLRAGSLCPAERIAWIKGKTLSERGDAEELPHLCQGLYGETVSLRSLFSLILVDPKRITHGGVGQDPAGLLKPPAIG